MNPSIPSALLPAHTRFILPAGTAGWARIPNPEAVEVGETWVSYRAPVYRPGDLATRAQLRAQGYRPVDHLGAEFYAPYMLESQLAEVLRILRPQAAHALPTSPTWGTLGAKGTHELWALADDLEQVRATPVLLAFDLPDDVRAALPEDADLLGIAQDVPPSQLGVLALIPDRERGVMYRYHVSVLGPDGVALCRDLGETLIALAAPARWWMYTRPLAIALEGVAVYELARQEWQSRVLATRGKERTAAKAMLAALEQARDHATKIRQARERRQRHAEDWRNQYAHARDLARQLAALYLDAHLAQLAPAVALGGVLADSGRAEGALTVGETLETPTSATSEPPTPAETPATIAASDSAPAPDAETSAEAPTEAARLYQPPLLSDQAGETTPAQGVDTMEQALAPTSAAKPARRERARVRRPALVTQDPPAAMLPTHALVRELMTGALLRPDQYKHYQGEGIAEYQGDMGRKFGTLTITIKAEQDEKVDAFLRQLNLLGDEAVDTWCALLMLAIKENGVSDRDPGRITQRFVCSQDHILQVADRKKSHGSYTAESRAKVAHHIGLFERMRVRAEWPTGPSTYVAINSPFLVVTRMGEYKTLTGEPLWEAQHIELGEWAAQLMPAMSSQLVPMLRTVLAYHSERDKYAKRLGRYLTLQFRVNAKNGGRFARGMRVLLEQSGIIPDRNKPGEVRTAIEGALARLKADGVIGDYRMIVDATPAAQEARERVEQRAYGWWHDYEQLMWEFDPPAYHADMIAQIQPNADEYRERAAAQKALPAPAPAPRKRGRPRHQ